MPESLYTEDSPDPDAFHVYGRCYGILIVYSLGVEWKTKSVHIQGIGGGRLVQSLFSIE